MRNALMLPLALATGCGAMDYNVGDAPEDPPEPCDMLQQCYDDAIVEPVSTSELPTDTQEWLAELEEESRVRAEELGYDPDEIVVETVCLPDDEVIQIALACEAEADVEEPDCYDQVWNLSGVDEAFLTIGQNIILGKQECPAELTRSWFLSFPSETSAICVTGAVWVDFASCGES